MIEFVAGIVVGMALAGVSFLARATVPPARVVAPRPAPWERIEGLGVDYRVREALLVPGGCEVAIEIDPRRLVGGIDRLTAALEEVRGAWDDLPPEARRAAGTIRIVLGPESDAEPEAPTAQA